MTTATPDTSPIELTRPLIAAAPAPHPKRDPYLIRIPTSRTRAGIITWTIGQVMFLTSVTLIALSLLLVFFGFTVPDAQGAGLGDLGLRLLPHSIGGVVASFAIRGWRPRIDRRDTVATQGLELLVAAFASVGVGFVVQTISRYAIMLIALLLH